MNRLSSRLCLALLLTVSVALATTAGSAAPLSARAFPEVVDLPTGWRPEGVAVGHGPVIYSGSLASGSIYAADLRTGEGEVVVVAPAGRVAVGLEFDDRSGFLFVAGGPAGDGYVYDPATGQSLAAYDFTSAPTFVNDVVVTRDAAYFTDSMKPQLYKVPLGPGGELPDPPSFETLPLSGDYVQMAGFNANGIDATPDGSVLVIVQSNTGTLFTVDPGTGVADAIDLGGYLVTAGDGILLDGLTLYVLRNQLNLLVEIALAPDLASGEVVDERTHSGFQVPTTMDRFGNELYVVNARFGTPSPGTASFTIVRLER